jgi:uncharacterized protein (TIGR03435 family)
MQLYADDRVQFEAASVKQASQCTYESVLGPGSVAIKGVPLKSVLMAAFKVGHDQIIGPSWLESDCFEIFAKLPEGSTSNQIPMMLQSLFVERFKMAAHKENRVSTGYTLVIDKNGPKLKEATAGSIFVAGQPRDVKTVRMDGRGFGGIMTMEALAKVLSRHLDGPVVDATGLKGEYLIDLSWAPDPAFGQRPPSGGATESGLQGSNAASTPIGDLFSAVRESLGLKLEARKTQVEFLVIDHIERVRTEN